MKRTLFIFVFAFIFLEGFCQPAEAELIKSNAVLQKRIDALMKKSEIIYLQGYLSGFGKNALNDEIRFLKKKKSIKNSYEFTTAVGFRLSDDSTGFYVPVMISENKFDELRHNIVGSLMIIKARIFKALKNNLQTGAPFMIIENFDFKNH